MNDHFAFWQKTINTIQTLRMRPMDSMMEMISIHLARPPVVAPTLETTVETIPPISLARAPMVVHHRGHRMVQTMAITLTLAILLFHKILAGQTEMGPTHRTIRRNNLQIDTRRLDSRRLFTDNLTTKLYTLGLSEMTYTTNWLSHFSFVFSYVIYHSHSHHQLRHQLFLKKQFLFILYNLFK